MLAKIGKKEAYLDPFKSQFSQTNELLRSSYYLNYDRFM